jgi:alkylated DNA nucleotide flippase Atl1
VVVVQQLPRRSSSSRRWWWWCMVVVQQLLHLMKYVATMSMITETEPWTRIVHLHPQMDSKDNQLKAQMKTAQLEMVTVANRG